MKKKNFVVWQLIWNRIHSIHVNFKYIKMLGIESRSSIHREPPLSKESPSEATSRDSGESDDEHLNSDRPKPSKHSKSETDRIIKGLSKEGDVVSENKPKVQKKTITYSPLIGAVCLMVSGVVLATLFTPVHLIWWRASNPKNCSYQELKMQYTGLNPNVWDSLESGIENILNKVSSKSANYLFIYDNGDVQSIVKEMATHAAKCFDNSQQLVEMGKEDFNSKEAITDYGKIIERFKAKIKSSNVVLIVNLNEVPGETAEALHFICDTENPLREDLVVFLTLRMPTIRNENAQNKVEKELVKMWSPKLTTNILDALITRVADSVINLQQK
uniref:Torsin n=1 Tax=Glossina palpalis gambiensis TaxID=67801 RepID=A0A1B0B6W5_9MUSC